MTRTDGPRLIELPSFGELSTGRLTLATLEQDIGFEVKRVFWTTDTPAGVTRGNHAHHQTTTVLVAVAGRIEVTTELPTGERRGFVLDRPDRALYLPPQCWRTMRYSDGAVQIALESHDYDQEDYIRSIDDFRRSGADSA